MNEVVALATVYAGLYCRASDL